MAHAHVAGLQAAEGGNVLCRPVTTSYFQIEGGIAVDGIKAEIRHFAWNRSCHARFQSDGYYVDYSLGPRSRGARLLSESRREAEAFGEVAFIPKGLQFNADCRPSEYHLLCLTFDNWAATRIVEREELAPRLPHCFDVRSPAVRRSLARLAREVRDPGFAQDVLVQTLSLSLLIDLARHLQNGSGAGGEQRSRLADWRLRRIRERIDADRSAALSIADLAEDCGMSARHLMRTFRNTVGISIGEYIAGIRIEAAKRELLRDDAMIKVVAGRCGFSSAAAFTAAFRKATGLTPRCFREEARPRRYPSGVN